MKFPTISAFAIFLFAALLTLPGANGEAWGQSVLTTNSSPWTKAYHTRVRLIAGAPGGPASVDKLSAGIHIKLDQGWKTYWRTPGGVGGVPPYFDWTGSKNVKSVRVEFPAPSRVSGEDGVSVGYKDEVVLPVIVEPKVAASPVSLALRLDYGVCREICVPVQGKLGLVLAPLQAGSVQMTREAQLVELFSKRVPQDVTKALTGQPTAKKIEIDLVGSHPELVVKGEFPAGLDGADLFVEAPDGLYIGLPERMPLGDGRTMRFRIDLAKGEDPKLLRGKLLALTFVSANGQSEMRWKVPDK